MKMTLQCLFSPRLYTMFRDGPPRSATVYEPQGLEKWGDRIISTANTIFNITLYTSPFICLYIYRRSYFSLEELKSIARFFGGVGCIMAFAFLIRGLGRASNPKYMKFMKALSESDPKLCLEAIRKYDFDFKFWPVNYAVPPNQKASFLAKHPFHSCASPHLPLYQRSIIQVLAFVATHTFALRLIYPGTISLIQYLLSATINAGRTSLVEEFDGKRAKVRTADGNDIDTIFVDKRKLTRHGNTLVICSEGNSGFYEIGIMTTPIRAGYSALGWNHPGFAGSTGTPFSDQEQNAIDAVTQYAINELGFKPEDIIMFGWSIGAYASAWAANQYPIKGLIMDATFDDLLPLAQNQMPKSWALLVKEVVRSHVDLNVAELVTQYPGPVQLIRRTEDEIICLSPGVLSTNRGNNLLLRLLEARHPHVTAPATTTEIAPLDKYIALLDTQRDALRRAEISESDKRTIDLISKYTRDHRSTHCTPLPEQVFQAVMEKIIQQEGQIKEKDSM